MDGNQPGCSSEQSNSHQTQQGETKDVFASQGNESDTKMVVQSDSQDTEERHSMKISDSDNHMTSFQGSSSKVKENGSALCGVDTVTEGRGKQCEDSFRGGADDSQSWCDPSILLDNSVEEFSINIEGNKDISKKVNLAQTLDEAASGREKNVQSAPEEESDSTTHSEDSDDEAQSGLAEQVKGKSEDSVPTSNENQAKSSHLQNEIKSLLSATSPLCNPSSDLEVGRVDFSTTPKENLMRMVSDLLDECDWLKKEKAR